MPEGIETVTPGAELSRLLDAVDRTLLNGHELVLLLQARARLLAWVQGELFADMVELSYSPPGGADAAPERHDIVDEFGVDEVRAALTWTRAAAESNVHLALRVIERLPAVGVALRAGEIDLPRVRVVVERTDHLDEAIAREVVGRVLPKAGELTTGQLRRRLDRLCLEVCPQEAAERYEASVDDRRVDSYRQPEGTGNLVGSNLPGDRVAAIMDRLTDIARKLKTCDETRSLDQLRADLFLDLLEGHHPHDPHRRPMVDIRVDLDTLIDLNEKAGEIPGWGPVIADIARRAVIRQLDGEWRVAVTDPDRGNVLWDGTTRRRPTAEQRRWVEARQHTCVFPGCRVPARRTDIDHAIEVAKGGKTLVEHLEPVCRHDHRLRHEGDWTLHQPHPGTYTWTSPRGHTYTTGPSPPP